MRWFNLKEEYIKTFKNKLSKEEIWNSSMEPDKMEEQMVDCIKRVAKDILGERIAKDMNITKLGSSSRISTPKMQ